MRHEAVCDDLDDDGTTRLSTSETPQTSSPTLARAPRAR
jgi:hypothetical protein